ncbi:MAG TPA: Uma2 family endonuclease [Gemmatimonadaceae bacterium]|jgi:Uma2 family endonuclease|nr:Uma2 family endonuclease [Gemmatimonadaceae bacterium]
MPRPALGPIVDNAELHVSPVAEHIMAMAVSRPRRWTAAEVERLVEAREGQSPRYELVDGELLVTPAPSGRHQRIIFHLAVLLHEYVIRERLGEVRLGPGKLDLVASERYEPDLFVLPAIDGRRPPAADASIRPLLIVEALSPGSSRHDRVTKRRAFQRNGVPEYWVVDGDAEAFEIWHPDDDRAVLADETIVWLPRGAANAFELDLRAFFASVADDAPL